VVRSYLYRCRVCGTEVWTDFVELEHLACKKCNTSGKWLVIDVKNRPGI
jgi:DNA-directed RNA polymerase subunit RPC12/RpoP